MSSVSYGRTVSKNYQSERAEVSLEIYDDVLSLRDTFIVARAIVEARLGRRIRNRSYINKLIRTYFQDEDLTIDDFAEMKDCFDD